MCKRLKKNKGTTCTKSESKNIQEDLLDELLMQDEGPSKLFRSRHEYQRDSGAYGGDLWHGCFSKLDFRGDR